MTANETKELLEVLRSAGVTHYKSPELELTLEVVAPPIPAPTGAVKESLDKISKMTALSQMDDLTLLDNLIPLPAEPSEAS